MKQVIRKSIKEKNNIKDDKPIYTLLLDGNSIMKRSLINKKLNDKGEEYGMVYQSLCTIKEVIRQYDFSFCYFLMDGYNSGQLRAYKYLEYKANRDKNYLIAQSEYDKKLEEYQRKVLKYAKEKKHDIELKRGETEDESFQRERELLVDILECLFVRTAMFDDVEGDDLIAYYVKNKKPNEKIVIVSGDRDLSQLINDDVEIYDLNKKIFIHARNHIEILGCPAKNILIKKIMCGDSSDNIKGIKGLGEKSFFKYFPKAEKEVVTVEEIVESAKLINEERASNRKKPLQVCENIVNRVTEGSQGKNIYKINKEIIDLSLPLLTEEAKEGMDSYIDAPLDAEGRDYEEIYKIIVDNGMTELLDEGKFGGFFSDFNKLIDNEKKYAKKMEGE